jgi:hypothetical protein
MDPETRLRIEALEAEVQELKEVLRRVIADERMKQAVGQHRGKRQAAGLSLGDC